jgi:hypothetical protein
MSKRSTAALGKLSIIGNLSKIRGLCEVSLPRDGDVLTRNLIHIVTLLYVFDPDEADVKRAFVRSSSSLAIAVMNNKLGTRAPHCVASTTQLTYLVVEQDAPPLPVKKLIEAGVQVFRASQR